MALPLRKQGAHLRVSQTLIPATDCFVVLVLLSEARWRNRERQLWAVMTQPSKSLTGCCPTLLTAGSAQVHGQALCTGGMAAACSTAEWPPFQSTSSEDRPTPAKVAARLTQPEGWDLSGCSAV